ncbi:MAG: phage portal protein [Clostridia bacterium]|nr:phage portal protein [Clostridia bacterium]
MTGLEAGNLLLVKSIEHVLGREVLISPEMNSAMNLWDKLYRNQAPWKSEDVKSMNLAAAIANELACQATLDFQSSVTGSRRAECLNKQVYQDVMFDIRRCVEHACASGGLVFKPYLDQRRLAVEYVPVERFFPLKTDSRGRVVSAVFAERLKRDGKYFTRLEEHTLDSRGVTVRNLAFSGGGFLGLGKEISLSDVPEWGDLAASVTIEGAVKPLFSYFKLPMANTIDPRSPLGVSVYSRCVELIREADKQFSRLLWEYEGGELAVDASVDALLLENGDMKMPALNRRLFRALDVDAGGSDLYSVFAPPLRDRSYLDGLNELLIRIEDLCGLARGTLSNINNNARTATELKLLRQRSYATVADIQKSLQVALEQLVDGLDMIASVFSLLPAGQYEVIFDFDDSIMTDREKQFTEREQLVQQGILNRWELRSWYLGETEEQAKKNLPNLGKEEEEDDLSLEHRR